MVEKSITLFVCPSWANSNNSYGFRPKRDAKQATEKVKKELYKNWYAVDADIQGYFDNINHEILLGLLKQRISDRRAIKLCRQWLQSGVIEENISFYFVV